MASNNNDATKKVSAEDLQTIRRTARDIARLEHADTSRASQAELSDIVGSDVPAATPEPKGPSSQPLLQPSEDERVPVRGTAELVAIAALVGAAVVLAVVTLTLLFLS